MMEETVLSLKWQSFPSHLAVSLDTCYEKQQFVDLSLVCKDGTILKCHKMVLANSSSFFRRLLIANDHPHPMIILHDIEADDLKTIVNFMYCGEIQVVQSEVRRLLKLAEILEVNGLRQVQTSVLVGETSNNANDTTKKTTAVSRLKIEENRSSLNRSNTEQHEISTRLRNKTPRFASPSAYSYKNVAKTSQDNTIRKNDEITINAVTRLDANNSGISIADINDLPSTSKGLSTQKRKESTMEPAISWPRILSAISKNRPLPLKKLCIMDEVEITAADSKQNEPLDRRKDLESCSIPSNPGMKYEVYIKEEVDLSPHVEEDIDSFEIDETDNDNVENSSKASAQMFRYSHRSTR